MISLTKSNTRVRFIIHLLVWAMLFSLPYVLSSGTQDLHRMMRFTWLPLAYSFILFYINYFLLTDLFLFRKKITLFVLLNLALIGIFVWVQYLFRQPPPIPGPERFPMPGMPRPAPPPFRWMIYKDNIYLLIPVVISVALKITEKWARTEALQKEAENQQLNSELIHLRYQLQPHFFFNSLNNIYSLIDISPARAQEAIHSLSKLMRYLLYETNTDKVSLSEEIGFMKKYIELMELRTRDDIRVEAHFPEGENRSRIAPLLFISLIENAFKHGISATGPSELFFNLTVSQHRVLFIAENTSFPKNKTDKSGSGIGLANLRKRLDLLYPGNYLFKTESDGQLFRAELMINLSDDTL